MNNSHHKIIILDKVAILLSLFIQFDFDLVLSGYIVSHYITLLYLVLFVTLTLTFFSVLICWKIIKL